MRVVHMVPALFGPGGIVGGAERYALELARYMADVTPTRLLTFGDHDQQHLIGSLRIRVLGNPWRVRGQRNNCLHPAMFAELADADVIHCHQLHLLASSTAAVLARLGGTKVFVSDLGGGGWDISAYISTDRWYHGHLHISQYSRIVAWQQHWNRAHVIYGGVDLEKFSPPPASTDRLGVVFVGRLMPHKGIDDLVEAMPPDIPLRIFGRPYHEGFADELKRLAAGKRVVFVHDGTDDAIVQAYRESMCVVLPSVYRTRYGDESKVPELLGQTLLEGMACGAAGVCTNVASMPEVVENGVCGFVVPPNDPASLHQRITQLAGDAALLDRLGRAARQRVEEQFNWPAVVKKCLDRYRNADHSGYYR